MGSSQRPVQTPQAEQALRRAAETACLQRLPEVTRDPPRLQALRWAAETSVQTLSQPLLAAAPPPPAGYAAGHLSPSLPVSPHISPCHTHTHRSPTRTGPCTLNAPGSCRLDVETRGSPGPCPTTSCVWRRSPCLRERYTHPAVSVGHTAGYVAATPPPSQHSQHAQHALAAAGYGAAAVAGYAPLPTGGYDVGGGGYGGVAPAGYGHGYCHGYSHAGAPGAGW